MPGLAALVLPERFKAAGVVEEMTRRMTPYPWLTSAVRANEMRGFAAGVVTFEAAVGNAVAASPDGNLTAIVYGEFVDVTGGAADGTSDAAALLDGWQREGADFFARINGEFVAAIVDGGKGELHVATDRFGLRPLYVTELAGGFAAASEIKAILAAPGVDRMWSDQGVAEFFSFGHFYGTETLLRAVRAVPPATVGTYRLKQGDYREATYWRVSPARRADPPADLARAFEDGMASAVARRARAGERLGLSLSGGLDARTILGLTPGGVDLQTVSLGIEGSLDHRSAAELARLASVPHTAYHLDHAFLSSFETHLREMVRLTDGHYLDQGIVMPTMEVYRRLGIEYLLRGHGGELAHMRKAYAFSLDDKALGLSEDALRGWLLSHLTDYMLHGVPKDLFTIDLRAAAEKALRQACVRVGDVERPVDRVWHLFLQERLHRETSLSMHLFGNFATIRQPYLDNDVIDALFAMPASMKLDGTLQTALLRRRRPEFVGVTNSNTGAPLDAGQLATDIARLKMRVFAKLGVKGYQPYERLGLWLRRELADFVIRTLTSERALDAGVFRPDAVKRVVAEHLEARRNHTFLIMSLLIYVLGREMATDLRVPARPADRAAG